VGVERNMNSCLPDYFPVMDKIGAGKALNAEMRTVRHSCIDMNRHMNNACYCQFGMDWLAEQGVAEKSVREVQLNFNHALKAGEMCSVCGELKENAFIVAGQSQEANKNAFMMDGILNGNSR